MKTSKAFIKVFLETRKLAIAGVSEKNARFDQSSVE
jgi:hypothetical protein